MSRVLVTSDLHLGHKLAAELRGFDSIDEHSWVLNSLQDIGSRDKVFIVGDVAFSTAGFALIPEIPGMIKILLMGNHDKLRARKYLDAGFHDVAATYNKGDIILSHIPIHPQEMIRWKLNAHGHLHIGGVTSPEVKGEEGPDLRYLNVNIEVWKRPLEMDELMELRRK